ncbi:hypothetical protein [Rhizobium sp. 2MFCol3.1]|uniref:hypothetical protein n=1 Tax=Rhizobium sp. 2MFCol3.1 TaxID=1246459 RepID=UPI0012DED9F9|nr:hypothetical protein [Rhizobium sp. 2MFCol3.1]
MSESLKPFSLTPSQVTEVLIRFAGLLEGFAAELPGANDSLAKLVRDAAASIRDLAFDVGEGDQDVAAEIVASTARLVGAIRKLADDESPRATIH